MHKDCLLSAAELAELDRVAKLKKAISKRKRFRVPGTTSSLLGIASKMPGFTWGIPAARTCPGKRIGPGSICGSCYALKANYDYDNVKACLRNRYQWTLDCLKTAEGTQTWVDTMVSAIDEASSLIDCGYFRIHDSGDFFNPAYAKAWAQVIRRLPAIKFWAPTKSYHLLAGNLFWQAAFRELLACPNLTLRPSADMFGDEPPMIAGFAAGSSATDTMADVTCSAYKQAGHCGPCTACWDQPLIPTVYPHH